MESFELVSRIALELIDIDQFDKRINSALDLIGRYLDVSRVYIFKDDDGGQSTSNIFEWCAEGVSSHLGETQNVPYEGFLPLKQALAGDGVLIVPDIGVFPENLRAILEPQGVKSLVACPLFIDREAGGFIGFDECRRRREWDSREVHQLKSLSGLVSGAFRQAALRAALEEQKTELERFFSINLDLLCIADVDGYFIKVNKAWSDILGYPAEALEKRKFLDFVHPEDIEPTLAEMARLEAGHEVVQFINRYRHKDGSFRFIEWRSRPYGRLIYAAARDVTDRVEYEDRLKELSIRDPLTGAYNRRFAFEFLGTLIAEHRRTGKAFSVAIVDLDHFKNINDTYGHQAGDFVLKEFCALIQRNLRAYDLLARYGGEEFIVFFIDVRKTMAVSILDRIRASFAAEVLSFDGRQIRCAFSGGLADSFELESGDCCMERIVEKVDARLYEAKRTGRNRIVMD